MKNHTFLLLGYSITGILILGLNAGFIPADKPDAGYPGPDVPATVLSAPMNTLLKESGSPETAFGDQMPATAEAGLLVINSYGFNAQKPSGFSINGVTERVSRGLTIIHFNSSEKYEFKTFDTYSSLADAALFFQTLNLLVTNNATFSILAHDSAAKSLESYSERLKGMGLEILSALGNRQAYLMQNLSGAIREGKNELALSIKVPIPAGIEEPHEYFPKIRYAFEPSVDRYIAHAGGEVNGIKSTNTREALDESYLKGFRMFELDIIETRDGHYIASHDWAMWSRFTGYKGELPVNRDEFLNHKVYGQYTTLTMEMINEWFATHPDATLITDKVNDPIKFAAQFIDKSRLIMELFSFMSLEEASLNGIRAMISQEQLETIPGDKLVYIHSNEIRYVAVSRRIIANNTELFGQLRDQGIKVYVYNVNFDPGKDERYVLDHEIGLVYGMYADKWIFDQPKEELRR